jgi:hypothetical protein
VTTLGALAWLWIAAGPAPEPDLQRPDAGAPPATPPEGTEPAAEPAPTETVPTLPDVAPDATPTPAAPVAESPLPVEVPGPPFYRAADQAQMRARYGLGPLSDEPPRRARFRCLIADPTCGFTLELSALGAYAYRVRQGDISVEGDVNRWHSGRAAYEAWLNFAVASDVVGRAKYTRVTLGPKAGLVASDTHDLWGTMGLAARYWFGRGAWAPALEFTSALSFRLRGERGGRVGSQRSPVGVTADVGLNVGGWGAIVVGGQYDTPLAREEVPESVRVSAGGMFFVGLRGNILWGVPAAAALTTHAVVQRNVRAP